MIKWDFYLLIAIFLLYKSERFNAAVTSWYMLLILSKFNKYVSTCLLVLVCFVYTIANASQNNTPIKVEITTHLGDKQVFQQGDVVSFLVSLDRDAWLIVIYENSKGQLVQLIPNRNYKTGFYKAGLFVKLLATDSAFQFKIQAPFGAETLWVFAAESKFKKIQGQVLENGLIKLKDKISTLREKLAKQSSETFASTKLQIKTTHRTKK